MHNAAQPPAPLAMLLVPKNYRGRLIGLCGERHFMLEQKYEAKITLPDDSAFWEDDSGDGRRMTCIRAARSPELFGAILEILRLVFAPSDQTEVRVPVVAPFVQMERLDDERIQIIRGAIQKAAEDVCSKIDLGRDGKLLCIRGEVRDVQRALAIVYYCLAALMPDKMAKPDEGGVAVECVGVEVPIYIQYSLDRDEGIRLFELMKSAGVLAIVPHFDRRPDMDSVKIWVVGESGSVAQAIDEFQKGKQQQSGTRSYNWKNINRPGKILRVANGEVSDLDGVRFEPYKGITYAHLSNRELYVLVLVPSQDPSLQQQRSQQPLDELLAHLSVAASPSKELDGAGKDLSRLMHLYKQELEKLIEFKGEVALKARFGKALFHTIPYNFRRNSNVKFLEVLRSDEVRHSLQVGTYVDNLDWLEKVMDIRSAKKTKKDVEWLIGLREKSEEEQEAKKSGVGESLEKSLEQERNKPMRKLGVGFTENKDRTLTKKKFKLEQTKRVVGDFVSTRGPTSHDFRISLEERPDFAPDVELEKFAEGFKLKPPSNEIYPSDDPISQLIRPTDASRFVITSIRRRERDLYDSEDWRIRIASIHTLDSEMVDLTRHTTQILLKSLGWEDFCRKKEGPVIASQSDVDAALHFIPPLIKYASDIANALG